MTFENEHVCKRICIRGEFPVKNLFLEYSGLVQRSGTDFIGPGAGPSELDSPERSPSESVSGPVESNSILQKFQVADPFEVRSGPIRTRTDP